MDILTTINVSYPNLEISKFDIYTIVKNDFETYLIGFDYLNNRYTALGIKENVINGNTEEHHVYHIKQLNQKEYIKIINSKIGAKILLPSDKLIGLWNDETFIKIEPSPNLIDKLNYFKTYILISKTSNNEFFKNQYNSIFKDIVEFNPYKI